MHQKSGERTGSGTFILGAKIVSGWKIVPGRPLRKTRLKKVRFTAPLVKARTEKQFSGVRRRRAVTVLQPPPEAWRRAGPVRGIDLS